MSVTRKSGKTVKQMGNKKTVGPKMLYAKEAGPSGGKRAMPLGGPNGVRGGVLLRKQRQWVSADDAGIGNACFNRGGGGNAGGNSFKKGENACE